jgi:ATP-dependent DNA helicase DinG
VSKYIASLKQNVQTKERFSEQCILQHRAEIGDTGGNEVFALGWLDDSGKVATLRVSAWGNEGRVLAYSRDDETDVFIHNHPSGFLSPSDNDLIIAGKAAGSGTAPLLLSGKNGDWHPLRYLNAIKQLERYAQWLQSH